MKNTIFLFSVLSVLFLQSCGLADLRTNSLKKNGITSETEQKGRDLLEKAWRQQGLDQMVQYETYEVVASDHWKGLLGSMGKVWPVNETPLRLRFAVGTFDSRVEILEGKKDGFRAGLQSWQYYEAEAGEPIAFQEKPDKRITFGLAAYHYFFELPDRLRRAPIVTYAGERQFDGQAYDLVFATWESPRPHPEHDQYLLYINRESGLVELASYTIRENYLPGPKSFYGTIRYSDFREADGVLIPFRQSVYANQPKRKEKRYLHKLTIDSFRFNNFDKDLLYPNPDLEFVGDDKVEVQP